MSSYERLAHALSVSNLHLLLFELNSGADPNCYCSISGDHILDFAETISEIVALLSFGGTPYSYNEWALAQAIADKKYLHLAVYFYWNFKNPPQRPQNIVELNRILFSLPFLKIKSIACVEYETEIRHVPVFLQRFREFVNS